ncbi:hypothetical protein M422DRAFT_38110 [Sphaerobolus stellatus SS14]|uniref:DUF3074 domain-containing protein n=1 Tax=Sphaerobolus stellatus (strain SS14) TaxID=990650 RepID=A0A0C9TY14_SPHS4|nr:hypothetical protein M422DRAFT_38110 [Sphaerobolus stellatus SS14]
MSNEVKLSIKPFTPSSKTFHGVMKGEPYNVTISSKARASGDEAGWYVRRSEHTDGTFDEFWEKLGRNKAINAKEYATLLKQISPTQSICPLHYHLIPLVSDRIFTVLQATHLEGGEHGTPREGRVISGPVDVSEDAEMKAKERKGVKGRYISVLRLREGIEGEALEWMMATSSTPGGSIPQFITERTMPSQTFKAAAEVIIGTGEPLPVPTTTEAITA